MASTYIHELPFHAFTDAPLFDAARMWRQTHPPPDDPLSLWLQNDAGLNGAAPPFEPQQRASRANDDFTDANAWAYSAPALDWNFSFAPSTLNPPSFGISNSLDLAFTAPLPNSPVPSSYLPPPQYFPSQLPAAPQTTFALSPSLAAVAPLNDNARAGRSRASVPVDQHSPRTRSSTLPPRNRPFRSSPPLPPPTWGPAPNMQPALAAAPDLIPQPILMQDFGFLQPLGTGLQATPTTMLFPMPAPPQVDVTRRISDVSDTSALELAERARPRKRHSLDVEKRQKVKQVRKLGACLRCRMYKEPCDQGTPCGNCLRKGVGAKLFRQPCYRESLDNVVASRLGDTTFGEVRYKEPDLRWTDLNQGSLNVKLGYTLDPTAPTLTFDVRKFIPRPADHPNLEHRINGQLKVINLPAIAIHDIATTTATMTPWLKSLFPYILNSLTSLEHPDPRTPPDPLLRLTLLEAQRWSDAHPSPNSAVPHALAVRLLPSHQFNILNAAALDIPTVNMVGQGNTGPTPLPPRLNAQIDVIRNRLVDAHKTLALKRFKALVFGRASAAREGWYELFLTTFLILSTIEHASRCQRMFMRFKRGHSSWRGIEHVSTAMLAEWRYSAENLVAHFRCAMRGHLPFVKYVDAKLATMGGPAATGAGTTMNATADGPGACASGSTTSSPTVHTHEHTSPQPRQAHSPSPGLGGVPLDDGAQVFIERVSQIVAAKRDGWEALRRRDDEAKFEESYIWLSQLFMPDVE